MKLPIKLIIAGLVTSIANVSYSAYVENIENDPFPVLERTSLDNATLKTSGWACDPYERKWIGPVADVRAYMQGKRSKVDKQAGTYTAPNYYAIEQYRRVEMGAFGNRSYNVTLGQPGQKTITNYEYEEVYENTQKYLLDIDTALAAFDIDAEFKLKLQSEIESFIRSYQNYSYALESTHGVAIHNGTARGQGIWKGGSLYEGYLDLKVMCVPPEMLEKQSLENLLKAYIDEKVEDEIAKQFLLRDDFSDGKLGRWQLPHSMGTVAVENGMACADRNSVVDQPWKAQFLRGWIFTQPGQTYRLSFDAKADRAMTVTAKLGIDIAPWTAHFIDRNVEIDTELNHYEFEFTQTESRVGSNFAISLGQEDDVQVCIDNFNIQILD